LSPRSLALTADARSLDGYGLKLKCSLSRHVDAPLYLICKLHARTVHDETKELHVSLVFYQYQHSRAAISSVVGLSMIFLDVIGILFQPLFVASIFGKYIHTNPGPARQICCSFFLLSDVFFIPLFLLLIFTGKIRDKLNWRF